MRRSSRSTTSRSSFADPQVQARDAVTTVDDEDLGPLRMQNVWFRLCGARRAASGLPGAGSGRTPTPCSPSGSATRPEQVAALHEKGVV